MLDGTDDPGLLPVSEGKMVHSFFRVQSETFDVFRRCLAAILLSEGR